MKKNVLLTRNQCIGILVLLFILLLIFVGLHFLPDAPTPDIPNADTVKKSIVHRQKHHYDSLYAVRTAHYDSIRLVRRDSLHQIYQEHRDSTRRADSLWWDSVYQSSPRAIKKDTSISLNRADTSELQLIRGIGSSMAKRIVRYRNQLGGFASANQLLDDQLYQDQYGHSIRSRYCLPDSVLKYFIIEIDSIKPIPVNHASVERLQSHPYISHTLAKEIYTLRRQNLTIKNIDEIRDLPHMSDSLIVQLRPYLSFEK